MVPVLDKLAEKYNLQLNREQAIVAKVTGLSLINSDTLAFKWQLQALLKTSFWKPTFKFIFYLPTWGWYSWYGKYCLCRR